MDESRHVITTADGSLSVYSERFGASYHSTHGALQETQHVYVQAGLAYVDETEAPLRILDVGFGTGLNFYCTAAFAKTRGLAIDYVGLEAYPLDHDTQAALHSASVQGVWRKPASLSTSIQSAGWPGECNGGSTSV